ncbi:MAG TPA: DNA-directed DNA polymerase I [Thermoprotei archaeon]|nr:DNA-directed DNA polymerase I [Thermoprotei archaeon]
MKNRLRKIYGEDLDEELIEWIKLFHTPIPSLRRVALDIEVFSPVRNRIPNPEEAQYPVIAISFSGSDGFKKVFILKRMGSEEEVKIENIEVKYFEDEREMLLNAFQIIMEYPIVVTFNGDNFDLAYLYHRAQKLGVRKEDIPIVLGREYAHIVPGIHIDLYKFFNNRAIQVYAFSNKYREIKTLNSISQALLNESKIPISKPISELSPVELASYCFQDADLTLKLTQFDNELVMKLIVVLMRIAKLPMEDITRHSISNWIKSLAYYEHRRRGFLIPNSNEILSIKGKIYTKAVIKGKKYMGAIVLDPMPGIFFDIVVVDFASLYPSMMKEWNLSYETVRCPHKECRDNIIPGTPHWVCGKRRGLLSKIVGYIRDLRVFIYKPLSKDKNLEEDTRRLYDVMQRALKVFINASYGVFGSENFSLYCPPVAESITALGRYAIIKTIEKAQSMNLAVLYGDTDSLFVWHPNPEKINELLLWSKKNLHIDLDIDKTYRFVAFSGLKKNYLGVLRDGRIDIKGLIGKKRNTPEFIKNLFKEVSMILASINSIEDVDNAIHKIRELTRKSYTMLRNKQYPLNDLAFRVTLTKSLKEYTKTTPQHVKAAFQLKKYGINIDVGDIISFVKIRGGDGVKALQLARIDEIDEKKYLEYIETTFRQILESIGVDFDDILGAKHLDKYF